MNGIYHFIFHNSFIAHLFIVYSDIYIRKELLQDSTYYIIIASRDKDWNDAEKEFGLGPLVINLDF